MPPKPQGKVENAPVATDKFIFRNGSKYEGEYIVQNGANFRHGKGTYTEYLTNLDQNDCPGMEPEEITAQLSQVYDGIWNLDNFVEGKVTYADNSYYEGKFDADGNYAEGKYVFENGSQWIGPFKLCKMCGEGLFIDKAGTKWRGVMADNQCISMIEVK